MILNKLLHFFSLQLFHKGGTLLPVTTAQCVKQLNQQSNVLQITSINQNVKNIELLADSIHTNAVSLKHSRQDNVHDFKYVIYISSSCRNTEFLIFI